VPKPALARKHSSACVYALPAPRMRHQAPHKTQPTYDTFHMGRSGMDLYSNDVGVDFIATSAIMSFIFSWNQFLFSLILSGPKTKTVPVAVYNFISYGKIDWAGIGAAATSIVLPVSVFAFFVRRTIVQGLTMGALKD